MTMPRRLMSSLSFAVLLIAFRPATAQDAPVLVGPEADLHAIQTQSARFSQAYMDGDVDAMVAIYTADGVAASSGRDFVRGAEALRAFWQLPEGRVVTYHRATPVEIRVDGDLAYDWGYYEGAVRQGDAEPSTFRGKYLIVWHRGADGVWRMAHDMWNSLD